MLLTLANTLSAILRSAFANAVVVPVAAGAFTSLIYFDFS